MKLARRQFLGAAAVGSIAFATHAMNHEQPKLHPSGIRAILFDAFVVFDPRAVGQRAQELLPGKGNDLINLWRTRQFEYTWLRTTGQQYRDFWHVTGDALDYAAASLRLQLSTAQRNYLMSAYRELPAWPDAYEVISELRRRGIRMAFLSNFTMDMLEANLKSAKLRNLFEEHLTTDRVRAFKPSPHAYQMGIDHFGLLREQIAYAAFAPWDAVGAKWFGYPTIWVNRMDAPEEDLGIKADFVTNGAAGLSNCIKSLSSRQ